MKIKVMSYNIFHCENVNTGKIDVSAYADFIRHTNADIIGLNEVRGKGFLPGYTAQVEKLAELLGYHCYFARAIFVSGVNPYGNALLSRYPILSSETIMIPDPTKKMFNEKYETRCLLRAEIDVGSKLQVLVTHFGLNPDEQENAVTAVIQNIINEKVVLMGDFNVTPDNTVLLPIQKLLYDTAECFAEEKFSFPSDHPDRKIDYLFVSKDIRVKKADIPPVVLSDHRPYVAEIKI